MRFVDEVQIEVRAGHGGPGCISFLREKYRPWLGPDGGNGGDGGSVIFVVDPGLSTLLDFRSLRRVEAKSGEGGRGKQQNGKRGADRVVRVPPGTIVRDRDTDEIIADLRGKDDRVVVARGGRGGRGNLTYATSTNQAPRRAQPGTPGEEFRLQLELRLMADVGIVGFPNAGKSSLIRRVSAARPRVADYPFTTLAPALGVVRFGDYGSFVMADIPGLIEGAHEGHGLGQRFLRHVSRTALLVHLIDVSGMSGRDPVEDFKTVNREIAHFDAELADKPQVVVGNKVDVVTEKAELDKLRRRFRRRGVKLHLISAVTGAGVAELINEVGRRVAEMRQAVPPPAQDDGPPVKTARH